MWKMSHTKFFFNYPRLIKINVVVISITRNEADTLVIVLLIVLDIEIRIEGES